jgi:hypothetical protein
MLGARSRADLRGLAASEPAQGVYGKVQHVPQVAIPGSSGVEASQCGPGRVQPQADSMVMLSCPRSRSRRRAWRR